MTLPAEEESCVRDPPLSALGGGKRGVRLREGGGDRDGRERRRSRIGGVGGRERDERRDRERERDRDGRRPGVAFAPVPGYGYIQPPGL